MLVATSTCASMMARSSTAIAVVRVGSGVNIPCIDLCVIIFLVARCSAQVI